MYVVYLLIYSFIEFPYSPIRSQAPLNTRSVKPLIFLAEMYSGLWGWTTSQKQWSLEANRSLEVGKHEDIPAIYGRLDIVSLGQIEIQLGTMGIQSGYNGDTMEHTSNNMIIGFVEQWRIPETIAI